MLRTRLWMGALLIALAVGALVVDQWLAPWYPFLLAVVLGLALVACSELLALLGEGRRLPPWLCYGAVGALILANWAGPVARHLGAAAEGDPWSWVAGVFGAVVLAAFLVEMARFQEPGESVPRIALTVWVAAYLGLLPCFFAQLRWLGGEAGDVKGSV